MVILLKVTVSKNLSMMLSEDLTVYGFLLDPHKLELVKII